MPKATKKTTTRKRTALKDLPAKVKGVTKKEGKRVKGGTPKSSFKEELSFSFDKVGR